jgi:alpha-glucosidase (family GH31 glycosyl hydrolase)
MEGHKDWIYNKVNFSSLPAIVNDLHDYGQHYINIIDPAVSITPGYKPYDEGLDANVFIKYYNSSEPLKGAVWSGQTVFPDFTNPNTTKWWTNQAVRFHKTIPFDGIWIVSVI